MRMRGILPSNHLAQGAREPEGATAGRVIHEKRSDGTGRPESSPAAGGWCWHASNLRRQSAAGSASAVAAAAYDDDDDTAVAAGAIAVAVVAGCCHRRRPRDSLANLSN